MSKTTKEDASFSDKFTELEEIVAWFNQEDTDLDESIGKFERGAELSKEIKQYLDTAENKVVKIKAQFDQD